MAHIGRERTYRARLSFDIGKTEVDDSHFKASPFDATVGVGGFCMSATKSSAMTAATETRKVSLLILPAKTSKRALCSHVVAEGSLTKNVLNRRYARKRSFECKTIKKPAQEKDSPLDKKKGRQRYRSTAVLYQVLYSVVTKGRATAIRIRI